MNKFETVYLSVLAGCIASFNIFGEKYFLYFMMFVLFLYATFFYFNVLKSMLGLIEFSRISPTTSTFLFIMISLTSMLTLWFNGYHEYFLFLVPWCSLVTLNTICGYLFDIGWLESTKVEDEEDD